MKLQDAQDKLHVFEQRSAEQTRVIAELTNKVLQSFIQSQTIESLAIYCVYVRWIKP